MSGKEPYCKTGLNLRCMVVDPFALTILKNTPIFEKLKTSLSSCPLKALNNDSRVTELLQRIIMVLSPRIQVEPCMVLVWFRYRSLSCKRGLEVNPNMSVFLT